MDTSMNNDNQHLVLKGKNKDIWFIRMRVPKELKPIIKNRLSNNYLFGDDWNNKDQLYKAFKKVRKYVGFDETYCWHSLRHSFATWAGAVDHPRNIMAALGHSSVVTTLKYCKATDEGLHSMIAKL